MQGMSAEQIFNFCTSGLGASNAVRYNLGQYAFLKLLEDPEIKVVKINVPKRGSYLSMVSFRGQIFCHVSSEKINFP